MKKIIMALVFGILTIGSVVMQVGACGSILGEDEVPVSLR